MGHCPSKIVEPSQNICTPSPVFIGNEKGSEMVSPPCLQVSLLETRYPEINWAHLTCSGISGGALCEHQHHT
jgi:hypothetical protein